MSFQITISPNRKAAARFVTAVRRAIQKAYTEEQESGLTQTTIARALGVHRSVINRELRGKKDLTLGRVAELAWAMDRIPTFAMPKNVSLLGSNLTAASGPLRGQLSQQGNAPSAVAVPANNNSAPVALEMAN
jgi:DNA-binding transcriptional regulator LsrR (DeoR family)